MSAKIAIYLLPVAMLVLATLASILPYLIYRRKMRERDEEKAERERIQKLSKEIVNSVPSNDGWIDNDYFS